MKLTCSFCHRDLNECKTDQRGLCIKSPQSDGKHVKRSRKETNRDRKLGY